MLSVWSFLVNGFWRKMDETYLELRSGQTFHRSGRTSSRSGQTFGLVKISQRQAESKHISGGMH